MDGLVVCGGRGSRLGPLGEFVNKCLLPIGGRTVLEWSVRLLADYLRCDRIVYATGHLADQVESFVAANDGFGAKYRFERDAETGESTYAALRGVISGLSDPFIYSHGNIALAGDAAARLSALSSAKNTTLAVSTAPQAPTHPHFRMEGSSVTAVGPLGTSFPFCSVGIGIYYHDSLLTSATAGKGHGPVEYSLSPDKNNAAKVAGVDIGDRWIHVEDLSVYADLRP
jgi:choline kinase